MLFFIFLGKCLLVVLNRRGSMIVHAHSVCLELVCFSLSMNHMKIKMMSTKSKWRKPPGWTSLHPHLYRSSVFKSLFCSLSALTVHIYIRTAYPAHGFTITCRCPPYLRKCLHALSIAPLLRHRLAMYMECPKRLHLSVKDLPWSNSAIPISRQVSNVSE